MASDLKITKVPNGQLRALVFWAAVGVRSAVAGSYSKGIEGLIMSYAKTLKMGLGKVNFKKVKRGKK